VSGSLGSKFDFKAPDAFAVQILETASVPTFVPRTRAEIFMDRLPIAAAAGGVVDKK
jgi:hypothetical protein